MTRIRTIVAVGLIVIGVVAIAGPTFGFGSIAADRAVSVTTADQERGLLGVNGTYDGGPIDNQRGSVRDSAEVLTLASNAGVTFTSVSVQVTSVTNDVDYVLEVAQEPAELTADGTSEPIELQCSGAVDGSGVEDVTVTIDVVADSLEIRNVEHTVTDFDYNCRDEGEAIPLDGIVYVSGSATTDGPDLTFDIENTGDQPVLFEEIAIHSEIADADRIYSDTGDEVAVSENGTQIGGANWANRAQDAYRADKGDPRPFDVTPELQPDTVATITIEDFGDRHGNNFNTYQFDGIDENGTTITVTLIDDTGSQVEFTFGEQSP